MLRSVLAAFVGCFFISGCATAPPVEVRVVEAGKCWFAVPKCASVQIQYGAIVETVDVCHDEWHARCREAELESYLREGCAIIRLPDNTKIVVSCGGQP